MMRRNAFIATFFGLMLLLVLLNNEANRERERQARQSLPSRVEELRRCPISALEASDTDYGKNDFIWQAELNAYADQRAAPDVIPRDELERLVRACHLRHATHYAEKWRRARSILQQAASLGAMERHALHIGADLESVGFTDEEIEDLTQPKLKFFTL